MSGARDSPDGFGGRTTGDARRPQATPALTIGAGRSRARIGGQVIVNPETDFPEERFAKGPELLVGARSGAAADRDVADATGPAGHRVRGIATMNDAEVLAGAELRIPAGELGPLPAGTFYRHDLIGCDVARPTVARDRRGDGGRGDDGDAAASWSRRRAAKC